MSRTKALIGYRIKAKRIEMGLTQQELAAKLLVDRQYISKLEGGKINMSLDYLDKVLTELNCTVDELFINNK
ncbi:MAG: helix-turn-helix transcriptional regulator [Bacteroidetes bacterium]|nr:helix-turn-helix transcriptional regulator [Bacteroidota bacterium]